MAESTLTSSPALVTATITVEAGAFTTTLAAPENVHTATSHSIFDPDSHDPTHFDPNNPLVMFIVQAAIIIIISRILAFGLGKLRQPRVIAEVVAGILVGPSVLGRIPGFTDHIFPPVSLPFLSLVANIGLVLFLFVVGLEVDFSLFRKNARASAAISSIGMIVPFGLGAAVAVGVYNNFVRQTVNFGIFVLFIGTANAITAFPVLARILTELQLLQNPVGVTVLSAGVGNDVVGWILLALSIALVNATSSITILYIILTAIAWILALWFLIRPLLVLLCKKTGAFQRGPSEFVVCVVLLLVFASAWITDRIGVHAIFGGFLVGLVVPQEIRSPITGKIEDLVSCIFLPLYFALSGLNTDLGLLASGSIWGWTVCVIFTAFFSKFLSCGATAKLFGMDWRESGAVGSLMACKGLVELIVLNIGLNARILNSEVFAMFVTMALVTTFTTTPLTILFYPPSYIAGKDYKSALAKRKSKENVSEKVDNLRASVMSTTSDAYLRNSTRFSLVLERFESLPAIFSFFNFVKSPYAGYLDGSVSQDSDSPDTTVGCEDPDLSLELLSKQSSHMEELGGVPAIVLSAPPAPAFSASSTRGDRGTDTRTGGVFSIEALRLIELTERTSALLKASEPAEALRSADSLTQVMRTFAAGLAIPMQSSIAVIGQEQYPKLVSEHAELHDTDMILLAWGLESERSGGDGAMSQILPNPLETMFRRGSSSREGSTMYASFVRRVFAEATRDVALWVDRGLENPLKYTCGGRSHLFFAFHSGADDRAALKLLIDLVVRNPGLSATVIQIVRQAEETPEDLADESTRVSSRTSDPAKALATAEAEAAVFNQLTVGYGAGRAAAGRDRVDTLYTPQESGNRARSEEDDQKLIDEWFDSEEAERRPRSSAVEAGLARISFAKVATANPLRMSLRKARQTALARKLPMAIVCGRGRRDAWSHAYELAGYLNEHMDEAKNSVVSSSEVRRSLGDIGTAYCLAGTGDQLLVVQKAAHDTVLTQV